MKKLALVGTSCAGKTTMALTVAASLRRQGILAEAIASTDRKHSFSQQDMMTKEYAQSSIILQHALTESIWASRGDTAILISDRAVVDYYSYFKHTFKEETPARMAIEDFVYGWANTYDLFVYMHPRPYVHDGKRPPNEFRMEVVPTLLEVLSRVSPVIGRERQLTEEEIVDEAHRLLTD